MGEGRRGGGEEEEEGRRGGEKEEEEEEGRRGGEKEEEEEEGRRGGGGKEGRREGGGGGGREEGRRRRRRKGGEKEGRRRRRGRGKVIVTHTTYSIMIKCTFTFAPHFAAASVSSVTPLSKSGSTYSIPGVYKLQTTCTQLWNGMEYWCGMEWNAATSD